jgi:hypothetical protein
VKLEKSSCEQWLTGHFAPGDRHFGPVVSINGLPPPEMLSDTGRAPASAALS